MHEDSCQSCRFLHDPIHRALSCLTSESTPERIFITSRPMLERIYILYQTYYVQDWLLSNVRKYVRKTLIVYQISTYVICLTSIESYCILDLYVRDLSNIRRIFIVYKISTYAICLTSEVLNVDLTHLVSDLGQTRQKYYRTVHKYTCTVHNQAAYDSQRQKLKGSPKIQWCELKVVTSKHEDCNLMFTKPRKRGWNIPSKRIAKHKTKIGDLL